MDGEIHEGRLISADNLTVCYLAEGIAHGVVRFTTANSVFRKEELARGELIYRQNQKKGEDHA